MRAPRRIVLVVLGLGAFAAAAHAQSVIVGSALTPAVPVATGGTKTRISLYPAANHAGTLTAATFGWSSAHCTGAAKLKFFRPVAGPVQTAYRYLTERGPFDVFVPQTTPVIVSVLLVPPVAVEAGDMIGITNLGSCGLPLVAPPQGPLPATFPLPTLVFPGDVSADVTAAGTVGSDFFVYARATDVPLLSLLSGRFAVTLAATNPRTGAVTTGTPTALGTTSGFFSLPDFTGDADFPEITVKMVDARGAPGYPGGFWFFYSSLTDVEYTLTVTDLSTGAVRIYSSSRGSPYCGAADTAAFPP